MPKFFVAGAGGFIGSHVVERLRAAGEPVTAMDRPGADLTEARAAGAACVEADLAQPAGLARALEGHDLAINASGLFDLAATEEALGRVNVEGARAFAEAARSAGVRRLVHLSSVSVYGLPARKPMDEEGPYRPRSAYERTKLAGEEAVIGLHGKGLEVAVLRPTLVYGERSRYGHALFIAFLAQMRAFGWQRFPALPGGPLGQHVHAADVARAAILCATHPQAAGNAYNVADRVPLGLGDTFSALLAATGFVQSPRIDSKAVWIPAAFALSHLPRFTLAALNDRLRRGHQHLVRKGLKPILRPRLDADWLSYFSGDYVFDTTRISKLGFEWEHPDFRSSIGEVVDWYRQMGWIPAPRGEKAAQAAA